MKFLQGLFGQAPGQFVSPQAYEQVLSNQLGMTPKTLEQLRGLGVGSNRPLSLEYFFYTNTLEKAQALSSALSSLGYTPEIRASASDKRESVITGWSPRMTMSDEVVLSWTREMCELGYGNDCEFDGWGTNPYQPA